VSKAAKLSPANKSLN